MANNSQFIYSPLLTDFGIKAGVGEFGGAVALAPLHRSPSIIGSYEKRARQKVGATDIRRAPGEEYKMKEASKAELVSFKMNDHGIVIPVPMELVDGYSQADLFQEKANAGAESLIEVRYSHADAARDAMWGAGTQAAFNAIYGSANVTTPSTKWDAAGSTIEADIAKAKDRVRKNCGFPANTVAMPQAVFDAITTNPNSSVYERTQYTNGGITAKQMLASMFGVEEIIVFGELTNTANPGQSDSFGDLFTGNGVLVFHRNTSPVKNKMTLAQTFYWENARAPFLGVMERFNNDTNSYELKASAYFEVKVTAPEAGQALYSVLS